jgi:hypothetical protein
MHILRYLVQPPTCAHIMSSLEIGVAVLKLKDQGEAKKAKEAVARRVKNGSLEVMQGRHTRRISRSAPEDAESPAFETSAW